MDLSLGWTDSGVREHLKAQRITAQEGWSILGFRTALAEHVLNGMLETATHQERRGMRVLLRGGGLGRSKPCLARASIRPQAWLDPRRSRCLAVGAMSHDHLVVRRAASVTLCGRVTPAATSNGI